jgi:hypothetical protein
MAAGCGKEEIAMGSAEHWAAPDWLPEEPNQLTHQEKSLNSKSFLLLPIKCSSVCV